MSRIDEALQRTGDGRVGPGPGSTSQAVFAPAWDESQAFSPADRFQPITLSRSSTHGRMATDASPDVFLSRAWSERLATAPEANRVLVEQFRRLAASLHNAQNHSGIRVIMLTSASPEEGKTLTALNLALVLSESYHRSVLLIDADLRRPSLGNLLELTDAPGLTESLRSPTEQKLAILPITPTLMLLPAGRPDQDPMGGLSSSRMRHIIEQARERFEWVILDAPPMAPMADASLLSEMVDGVVFVVRAGRSQHALVQKAVDGLGRERILGVVLNGVADMPAEQYAYPAYDTPRLRP